MVATEQAQLLSTGAAARTLGISVSLLSRYEKEGRIPRAQRLAGSARRVYSLEELETIRAAREAGRTTRRGAAR